MIRYILKSGALCCLLFLYACGGDELRDINAFMQEAKENARNNTLDELPVFVDSVPFEYSSSSLRSPFKIPVSIDGSATDLRTNIEPPDEYRVKEYLEQFPLEQLKYVGVLAQAGQRWALIEDPDKKVHRVPISGYLGPDHGKLSVIQEDHIIVLELVPSGINSWVERPRTISLGETAP